jgi:hypothetical protein
MYTAFMSTPKTLVVHALWDDDAQVWVATSDDVPGLATESGDMNMLVEKLQRMIPELLQANGIVHGERVPFEVLGQRFAIAQTA